MPETIRDVTVAHRPHRLRSAAVERTLAGVLPEPIKDHFVVVDGRRYPPNQVLGVVTGLERSAFTSHQALRVLRGLGFVEGRRAPLPRRPVGKQPTRAAASPQRTERPTAEALEPYIGEWVATRGAEVLVSAASVKEIDSWLSRHGEQADGMFRVPRTAAEASGLAPQ